MANALTVEQSAIRMGITVRTARKYLNQARKKLDAETRDQMMARAGALGIIDPFTKDPFFSK
jgi:DNA-binding CsgD family transcriptional regulator